MRKLFAIGIALVALISLISFFAAFRPEITGNAIVGSRLLVMGGAVGHACNFTMEPGWNLVSIVCALQNTTVPYVLQSIQGGYQSVHGYDLNDSNDPWKSYNPGLPSWVEQDLTNITADKGYWININGTANYYAEGIVQLTGRVPLEPGWNLAGYPIRFAKDGDTAFGNLLDNMTSAHAYNATDYSDHWKVYVPGFNSSFNDLTIAQPTWGYWINVTNSSMWVISEW
jgi:hypothetical protein